MRRFQPTSSLGLVTTLTLLPLLAACDPPVLAEGAVLHSANGMAFDPQGRLAVASLLANEVVKLDPWTGHIVASVGSNQGVNGPDDITYGPDGSLYWTALASGEVGRRTPNGVTTTQLVAPGVNPITFSDDGRLFVGVAFLGDALYELDPALSAPPRLIAQDWGFLNGMDFGPDGLLYAPVFLQGRVVRIDVDSCDAATDPYTECDVQTVADGFFIPAAAKFDSLGRLHVVDQSGEVFRVDIATGHKQLLATLPPGLDNLTFDSQDRLFVSSANDGFVVRVRTDGSIKHLLPGGMVAPGGLALLGGSLYVADVFSMRAFDPQTGAQTAQITPFVGQNPLTNPINVAPDGPNLLVSSWFGNAVQVWDTTGQVLETYSDFAFPSNALRFQGDLVVAEFGFAPGQGQILRQTPAGRVTLAADLDAPTGLAADGGDLWFADWATGDILQIIDDGQHLPAPLLVASGLHQPEGLTVDLDGTLLVVESGAGRLSRVDPATGAVSEIATGLATGLPPIDGVPQPYIFSGVAVSPTGEIYVAGDLDNVIYRL